LHLSIVFEKPSHARGVLGLCVLTGMSLVATAVLVVLPVVGSRPSAVAAAATDPSLVVAGDISCGPTDPNFSGSNSKVCQQRATAKLVHRIAPSYLLPGGDTQYDPSFTEGAQPTAADYTKGYDASWGQLQNSTSANYVPGLAVRPTPGDHEYGDAQENDRGLVSNASNYFANFGPSGLHDLPAAVTGPSNDFYSFDVPVTGGTWHIISLDGECAALPATPGGAPSQSAAGCASGSPEETFLHSDLLAHQGDCTLIHWHQPTRSEVYGTNTDYQAFWNDAVTYHVTAIVNGHAHDYERWVPTDQNGAPSATGVTEFVAGTGGWSHASDAFPNSKVVASDFTHFGVLQFTLHAKSAGYAFKTVRGTTTDSGTLNCKQPTGAGAPTVSGVSPSSGSTAGGISVTITGTNFTGSMAVRFGSTPATTFQVKNATQITATAPTGAVGTVDVSVTNAVGTSASGPSDQFSYVAPPGVITAVGGFTSTKGVALSTLALSPQGVGDVLMVFAQVGTPTATVSSVSGGGVSTWTKAVQFAGSVGFDTEIWFGKVTTTGPSTITFTWSGSIAAHTAEYGSQEFTAGLGASTVWAADKSGTINGASSTNVPFPALSPSVSGELYFGYAGVVNSATGGSTLGFTYNVTAKSNIVSYDPNVSGAVSPTATQSPAGASSAIAVLMRA
jgi:hypothetical protein